MKRRPVLHRLNPTARRALLRLEHAELVDLDTWIHAAIEATRHVAPEQNGAAVERAVFGPGICYRLERVACGKKNCGRCGGRKKKHGPYWYSYTRDASGRVHHRYVGKELPEHA